MLIEIGQAGGEEHDALTGRPLRLYQIQKEKTAPGTVSVPNFPLVLTYPSACSRNNRFVTGPLDKRIPLALNSSSDYMNSHS
jgi:hypothetical protein